VQSAQVSCLGFKDVKRVFVQDFETSFDSIASTSQEGLEEEDPSLSSNRTLKLHC
ncbi:hypothetical protein OS493_039877, partial [Desmophyllum pertusum]